MTCKNAIGGATGRIKMALSFALLCTAGTPLAHAAAESSAQALPPAWTASNWQPPAAQFDIDHEEVTVRMDDGVVLRADVLYPKDRQTGRRAEGPFPVLLEQTPYRWAGFANLEAVLARGRYFVDRGYIYVLAHQRGTASSGGVYDLLGPRESEDGKMLVNWASKLQHGDGQIGLVGCSADGLNQFLTAARLGPDSPVRAMAANGIGDNLYGEPVFPGGMYSAEGDWFFEGVVPGLGTSSAIEKSLAVLKDLRSGGSNALSNDFWASISAGAAVEQVVRNKIPVLLYSSWDDVYPSSPYLLTMLQNAQAGRPIYGPFQPKAGEGGSPRFQIIMAPGLHCSGDNGGARDQANFRWFETWLRGAPTGLASIKTPFHFHSLNSPSWQSFTNAPQTGAYKPLYLAADGKLAAGPPKDSGTVQLAYGDRKGGGIANAIFTSEPFGEPTYIAGSTALSVTVETASPDVLVIGDLFDVAPDGTETRITRGNLVGSMRTPLPAREWRAAGMLVRPGHDFSTTVAVVPNRPMDLDVPLQPRLVLLDKGHRLRLVIKARSDALTRDCHFQLGPYPCLIGTLPQQRAIIDSTYTVRLGGKLALPLIAEPKAGKQ
ncbi:CocE/NonD family hydrolase [Sphingopyxis panaciterrae]